MINCEVYKVTDIMKILSIGKNSAYKLMEQEGFPVIKIKNAYRVPKRSFDVWLNTYKTTNIF